MTVGPALFRPTSVPFMAVVCGILSVFFIIQGIIVSGWMTVLSLVIALIFVLGASWFQLQSRRSSVLIDTDLFVVSDGRRQRSFNRSDIRSVDLSSLRGHVTFYDGSTVSLPLEGRQLIEAGILLTPVHTAY